MFNDEIILKILILGDMSVGKTTLLLKYIDNYTPELYISTLGIDYKTKNIVYNNTNIILQIWDTAGQEKFQVVTKSFVKGSDGIIYMYDITQKQSFINIKRWLEDTEDYSLRAKKIIVGNKIDMEERREVTEEMKNKLLNEIDIDLVEISAKKDRNVNEVFDKLVKIIIGDLTKEDIIKKFGRTMSVSSLNSVDIMKKKKKCC
jgi:small GTP-binding protein